MPTCSRYRGRRQDFGFGVNISLSQRHSAGFRHRRSIELEVAVQLIYSQLQSVLIIFCCSVLKKGILLKMQ